MIRTTDSIHDIPSTWIFEHYLGISLERNCLINSIFNANDKNPSMSIYKCSDGQFRFYDFSTGIKGDCFTLVEKMFNLDYAEAKQKIKDDYFGNTQQYQPRKYNRSYKVTGVNLRYWETRDINYWSKYYITKNILEKHNIFPLLSYEMSNGDKTIIIDNTLAYGYFDDKQDVYKIYQPGNKQHKFLKIKSYTQGYDQLKYKSPLLIICSSMKDLMCVKRCLPEVECIAPDSENTMLKQEVIDEMKNKFHTILVMFDNDQAGMMNMHKYKIRYGLNYINFNVEKDIADCVKAHGIKTTRELLLNKLNTI